MSAFALNEAKSEKKRVKDNSLEAKSLYIKNAEKMLQLGRLSQSEYDTVTQAINNSSELSQDQQEILLRVIAFRTYVNKISSFKEIFQM